MLKVFDTNKEYLLQSDRVLLRPLQIADVDTLLPFALHEPDLWKYSLLNPGGSRENMTAYIEAATKARDAGREYPFIVFDKTKNACAGSTRFYDINREYGYVQLGYTWYGEKFQGTGLNKNCKYLMLSFAFDTLGFERVEFRADNNNARSIAAMKSIGCTPEGVLRSHMPNRFGGRRDSIVLSILQSEWNNNVKEKLAEKIQYPKVQAQAN